MDELSLRPKRNKKLLIGVDLMGSDNAPSILINALQELPLPSHVQLLLIGSPEFEKNGSTFLYCAAKETIDMEEAPLAAIRQKKESSLCIGMRLLKEGKIHALVSAGNTGALVTAAKVILGTVAGILRPALLALMPTKKAPIAVLDVGANLEAKTAHLVQFALMGIAYQKARGIQLPSVGMLNIGTEPLKGTSELRIAYQKLQTWENPTFRFMGNIEGKNVFDGEVDVLITDGFTGNVFLKTAEGIASLILDQLHEAISLKEMKKLSPQLDDLQRRLHYAEYPGALLAGVRGIVIKCHGYSTPKGFTKGVLEAVRLASEDFLETLQKKIK